MFRMKTCLRCETEKDFVAFGSNKRNPDGLSTYCKICNASYQNDYNRANPEKKIANNKKYRTTHAHQKAQYAKEYVKTRREQTNLSNAKYKRRHPEKIREINMRRRARIAGNGVSLIIDKDMRQLTQRPCVYCGGASEHIDHVVPLSRGGRHSIGNLVPSCAKCNMAKSNKFLVEWKVGV